MSKRNAGLAAITMVYFGVLTAGMTAAGRDPIDLSGGYAFLHKLDEVQDDPIGWVASVGWYPVRALGVAGEIGGSYHTLTFPGQATPLLRASTYNFMGGPRLMWQLHPPLKVFAQVLLGGVRLGNNYGPAVSYFGWQPGGGLDVAAARHVSFRVQADFRLIPVDGETIKDFRLSTGIVLGVGH